MGLSQIFMQILNMGITASVVIVAVLLARGCMHRLPKKYVYFMWLIVGIRLVCPIAISSPVSIFNLAGEYGKDSFPTVEELFVGEEDVMAEKDRQMAEDMVQNKELPVPENDMVAKSDVSVEREDQIKETATLEKSKGQESLISDKEFSKNLIQPVSEDSYAYFQRVVKVVAIFWVLGILLLLSWNLYLAVSMKLRLRKAVIYRDNIYECDNVSSPFVMGLLHPHIYIPFRLGEEEREYILKHEQYHIQRKDYLVKLGAFLLVAIYWFHPLVWLSYFCMVRDMEMSCDEYVLGTMDADIRGQYSMSLLGFAMNKRGLSMGVLAFGETNTRKRVRNIMNFKTYKKGIGILAALLVMAVGVVCLTNAKVQGEQKDTVGQKKAEAQESETATVKKTESKDEVAAVVGEVTVNGYQLKLVLAAEEGKSKEDMLENGLYKGTFVLMTYGEDGSLCDEQELSFPDKEIFENSEISYPENVTLVLSDYDGDGVEDDFSLGQGQMSNPALGNYMVYKFFTVEENGSIVQYRTNTENGETISTIPGDYSEKFKVKDGQVSYLGFGEDGKTQKMLTNVTRVVSVKDESLVDVEPEKGIWQAVRNVMPEAVVEELENKGAWRLVGNSYLLGNGISYEDITLRLDFTYHKDGRLSQYVSKDYGYVMGLPEEKIDEEQAALLVAEFAKEFCGKELTVSWNGGDSDSSTSGNLVIGQQIWQVESQEKWGDDYVCFQDSYGATYLVWLSHNMVVNYQAGDKDKEVELYTGSVISD